jgi:hypothetical protein
MAEFIETVDDRELADRLQRAVHGRSAFRRFRDQLAQHPDELTRFHLFADERQRGRARRWLALAAPPERTIFDASLDPTLV